MCFYFFIYVSEVFFLIHIFYIYMCICVFSPSFIFTCKYVFYWQISPNKLLLLCFESTFFNIRENKHIDFDKRHGC